MKGNIEGREVKDAMAKRLMHFLVNDDPMKTRIDEIPEMARALTLDDVNAVIWGLLSVFDEMMRFVTASKDNALKADGVIMPVAGV